MELGNELKSYSMIKEIDNYCISMCYGGMGECFCYNSDYPNDDNRKFTKNEEECKKWCEEQNGTAWKYLSLFGFLDFSPWHSINGNSIAPMQFLHTKTS